MIRSVSSLSDTELDSTLAHLEQSEIVHLIDSRTSLRYAFKHALVRDAAYESLLKSSRAEIHEAVKASRQSAPRADTGIWVCPILGRCGPAGTPGLGRW